LYRFTSEYCRITNFCWFKQLISATELGNQPPAEEEEERKKER
jgi:hypothetical protein